MRVPTDSAIDALGLAEPGSWAFPPASADVRCAGFKALREYAAETAQAASENRYLEDCANGSAG